VTEYAGWDSLTHNRLQQGNDEYRRPLFSFMPDDPCESDPEHSHCQICQDNRTGARWVPDNGGAWVNPGLWERMGRNHKEYVKEWTRYNSVGLIAGTY